MKLKSGQKIWILEDDPGCIFTYQEILSLRYDLEFIESIEEFETKAAMLDPAEAPKLIIIDIRLQDGDFLSHLGNESKGLKKLDAPFMMVSCVDDLDALRFAFEKGASEFMTKPIKTNELIVKIEKIIDTKPRVPHFISDSDFLKSMEIPNLTLKEYRIIDHFLKSNENTITREDILQSVWKDINVQSKTLDVHLYNLRKKIEEHGLTIKSVGRGRWQLITDISKHH